MSSTARNSLVVLGILAVLTLSSIAAKYVPLRGYGVTVGGHVFSSLDLRKRIVFGEPDK